MSGDGIEFAEARPSARKPRTHRADRDVERKGGLFIRQIHPDAENEDVLFASRQRVETRESFLRLSLVIDALVSPISEVWCGLSSSQPAQGGCEPALGAALVPQHVRRDPIEPGHHL